MDHEKLKLAVSTMGTIPDRAARAMREAGQTTRKRSDSTRRTYSCQLASVQEMQGLVELAGWIRGRITGIWEAVSLTNNQRLQDPFFPHGPTHGGRVKSRV